MIISPTPRPLFLYLFFTLLLVCHVHRILIDRQIDSSIEHCPCYRLSSSGPDCNADHHSFIFYIYIHFKHPLSLIVVTNCSFLFPRSHRNCYNNNHAFDQLINKLQKQKCSTFSFFPDTKPPSDHHPHASPYQRSEKESKYTQARPPPPPPPNETTRWH